MSDSRDHADEPSLRRDWLRRADVSPTGVDYSITVTVDGASVELREGDTVAAAVLLAGHATYRTTVIGETPRAPFCMMGVCFDCLVEIDGVSNRQGCLVPARNGMRIVRQFGLRASQKVSA